MLALVVVVGVGVIGFVLLQTATGKSYSCDSLLTPPPSASGDPALRFETSYQGNQHVPPPTPIRYGFCPPTSGNHYYAAGRGPINAAVYGPASEQAPGGWVHNLEHGSVVLLYRCPSGIPGQGDCPSNTEMATLQQWFNDTPVDPNCGRQAVVARFDSMTTRFAVLSWNRALMLDTFDNSALALADNFAQRFTDLMAPEPLNC
jgi:hypothetical protein